MKKRERPSTAQYMREYRKELKAHGICVRCLQESALPGLTACRSCREKYTAYNRSRASDPAFKAQKKKNNRARYLRRVRTSRCPHCSRRTIGKVTCDECLSKWDKRRREKHVADGKVFQKPFTCGFCKGTRPPERHGYSRCPMRFEVGSIDEIAASRPGAGI